MSLETSIEQLAAAITLLASKIGTAPAQTPVNITTVTASSPKLKVEPKAEVKPEPKAETPKVEPEAEKPTPKPEPKVETPKVEDPKPEVSVEQIRAVATELIMKDQTVPGTRDKVVAVWAKYGVTKIKDLKPKDYTNVLADLKALNA
jgi:outer membrane biosynthesis protein TonB